MLNLSSRTRDFQLQVFLLFSLLLGGSGRFKILHVFRICMQNVAIDKYNGRKTSLNILFLILTLRGQCLEMNIF
jgi:hypothetical protein